MLRPSSPPRDPFARSSAEDAEAFEKEIRPLLIENCRKCHGAEKQKGGLRVDSRKALVEGGESGPAVVPGPPGEEPPDRRRPAIGASFEMPPGRKLRDEQIAALERWVAAGAPWPAEAPVADRGDEARRRHWAFQPVGTPSRRRSVAPTGAGPRSTPSSWPASKRRGWSRRRRPTGAR